MLFAIHFETDEIHVSQPTYKIYNADYNAVLCALTPCRAELLDHNSVQSLDAPLHIVYRAGIVGQLEVNYQGARSENYLLPIRRFFEERFDLRAEAGRKEDATGAPTNFPRIRHRFDGGKGLKAEHDGTRVNYQRLVSWYMNKNQFLRAIHECLFQN